MFSATLIRVNDQTNSIQRHHAHSRFTILISYRAWLLLRGRTQV